MTEHTSDCRIRDDGSVCDCGLIAFQESRADAVTDTKIASSAAPAIRTKIGAEAEARAAAISPH